MVLVGRFPMIVSCLLMAPAVAHSVHDRLLVQVGGVLVGACCPFVLFGRHMVGVLSRSQRFVGTLLGQLRAFLGGAPTQGERKAVPLQFRNSPADCGATLISIHGGPSLGRAAPPLMLTIDLVRCSDAMGSFDQDGADCTGICRRKASTSGWWRFYFADERWQWSPEVERIYGYQARTARPTTELVLSHKHPDDYEHVAATLKDIRRLHNPFSTRHRIVTVQGDTRDVIVIGERLRKNCGNTIGFYIGVTPSPQSRAALVREAVAEFKDRRAH